MRRLTVAEHISVRGQHIPNVPNLELIILLQFSQWTQATIPSAAHVALRAAPEGVPREGTSTRTRAGTNMSAKPGNACREAGILHGCDLLAVGHRPSPDFPSELAQPAPQYCLRHGRSITSSSRKQRGCSSIEQAAKKSQHDAPDPSTPVHEGHYPRQQGRSSSRLGECFIRSHIGDVAVDVAHWHWRVGENAKQ